MLFVPAVLTAGLVVGLLSGGSLRSLGEVRVRWWWLAPAALAMQAVPTSSVAAGIGLLAASYGVLIALAAANLSSRWFWGVLVGIGLNLVVIVANGSMPVSAEAARVAAGNEAVRSLREGADRKHRLADDDDVLLPLSDVIPVSGFGVVISVGDVLAYGSAAGFLASATRSRRRGTRRSRSGTRR